MRTVRLRSHAGPDPLRVEDAPVPRPSDGELLIEVEAVGVTLPSVRAARRGGASLPDVPGGDVVGRVAAVGAGVAGFRPGQRVAAIVFAGAYAEFVVVPVAFAAPVPDGVSDEAAVTLVRGGQVALGVLSVSGFRAGERVLVTAAAGGVGHLAVQLAVALGAARVVAAVGRTAWTAKAEALRALGADEVIAYDELGAAEQVDVALDGAGGSAQAGSVGALAPWGRLVAYSAAGEPLDVNELRLHARSVIGFAMAHFAAGRADDYARHRQELWDRHLAGEVRPLIDRVLPLEEAACAHRLIERRGNVGRVLLRP